MGEAGGPACKAGGHGGDTLRVSCPEREKLIEGGGGGRSSLCPLCHRQCACAAVSFLPPWQVGPRGVCGLKAPCLAWASVLSGVGEQVVWAHLGWLLGSHAGFELRAGLLPTTLAAFGSKTDFLKRK